MSNGDPKDPANWPKATPESLGLARDDKRGVTLPSDEAITDLPGLLAAIEQRAEGWNERADHILNGRIIRDELILIGNTIRPLLASTPSHALPKCGTQSGSLICELPNGHEGAHNGQGIIFGTPASAPSTTPQKPEEGDFYVRVVAWDKKPGTTIDETIPTARSGETPRTDERCGTYEDFIGDRIEGVPASFARQLERELAESERKLDLAADAYGEAHGRAAEMAESIRAESMPSATRRSIVDELLRPPHVRVEALDFHGLLWGIRLTDGCSNGCVELYLEDDDFWHLKATFDRVWLEDLRNVIEFAEAKNRADGTAEENKP